MSMDGAPQTAPSVVVTGLGMVSPLGFDCATSIASYRAKLLRVAELDITRKRSEDGEVENLIGHRLPGAVNSFQGEMRIVEIARMALNDLIENTVLTGVDFSRTGFYFAVPDESRLSWTGAPSKNVDTAEPAILSVNGSAGEAASAVATKLLNAVIRGIPKAIVPKTYYVANNGHAGVIAAVNLACRHLIERKYRHCIVAGVDSLSDEEVVTWLESTGRLKCSERSVGVVPGEGGAFFVLELDEAALERRARVRATVDASAVGVEPDNYFAGGIPNGVGLASTISALGAQMRVAKPLRYIFSDNNGETYRARELGNALVRAAGAGVDVNDVLLEFPATGFGDTGAASGAFALCAVVDELSRSESSNGAALIVSSADAGMRGAMILSQQLA